MNELINLINKTTNLTEKNESFGNMSSFFQEQLKQCQSKIRTIVVIGEVKKGKSTLINTLLGKTTSPVSSDVATSTVIEFGYAPTEQFVVHHLPTQQGASGLVTQINPDELETFVTEDGNPNNTLLVDKVSIHTKSSFLEKGYRLVDTPGLGGLYHKHAAITWKHVPNADIILFVVDSVESLMTKEEVLYLQKIAVFKVPIVFVQTKIDMVEAEQWKTWMNRNLSIISEALKIPIKTIPFFPISAKIYNTGIRRKKDDYIKSSLFPPLLSYLLVSLPKQQELRAMNLCRTMSLNALDSYKKTLEQSLKVLTSPSHEALNEISQQLQQRKSDFIQWKNGMFLKLKEQCHKDMQKLQKSTQRRLQDLFNTSPSGELLLPFKEQIAEISRLKKDSLYERSVDLVRQVEEECVKKSFLIFQNLQEVFASLFSRFDRKVSSHIDHMSTTFSIAETTDVHVQAPSIMRNIMAAKGMGTLISAGIAGVASTAGGIALGPITLGVISLVAATAMLKSNQIEQNKQLIESIERKIMQKLNEAIGQQRIHIMRHFEDTIASMNSEVEAMQKAMLEYQQQKIDKEINELSSLQKETKDSLNAKIISCKQEYAEVDLLLKKWSILGQPSQK